MKNRILVFLLQVFFFLLPWQTRWMYDQVFIGGGASAFGVLSLYATEVWLGMIFLLALPLKIPRSARGIALGAFGMLVVAGCSLFVAHDVWLAGNGWMHLAFVFLLFLLLLDARVDLREMLKAFVAGLIIPSFLGVYQVLFGGSGASTWLGLSERAAQHLGDAVVTLADGTRIERAYGSFSHPNIFGGYLTTASLALLWLRKGEGIMQWRRIYFYAFFWFVGALAFTCSRSAWLGLFLGLCVGGWIIPPRFTKKIRDLALPLTGTVFAILCAFFFALPGLQQRFALGDRTLTPSVTERAAQYVEYGSLMQGSWMFGHGVGNYPRAVSLLFPERAWWQYQPIHNVPLLILGELGLAGAGFVLLFLLLIDRKNRTRTDAPEAMIAFSFIVALLPIALLDHYLWSFWSGLALCALVMACAVRFGSLEEKETN